jgi:hypothetical protein
MNRFLGCLVVFAASYVAFLASARAQTATVIPANEAAGRINQYATVEAVVAKVFTSKSGKTFLNIGIAYPNQTFTGWIPGVPGLQICGAIQYRGKARQDPRTNRALQKKA